MRAPPLPLPPARPSHASARSVSVARFIANRPQITAGARAVHGDSRRPRSEKGLLKCLSLISVGHAIARISVAHPRLRLQIITMSPDDIVRLVKDGGCDVGLAQSTGLEGESELIVEHLAARDIHFACRPGHPLAGTTGVRLEDVRRFPLASTHSPGALADIVGKNSALGHLDPVTGRFLPAIQVNSLSLARLIASCSDALFAATAPMLAADIAAGRLVLLDFHIPIMQTGNGLIRRSDRTPSPALELFMQTIRQLEAEIIHA